MLSLDRADQSPLEQPDVISASIDEQATLYLPKAASVQISSYVLPARQTCTRHRITIATGQKNVKNKTDLNCQQCRCQLIVGYSLHNTATTRTNNTKYSRDKQMQDIRFSTGSGCYTRIFLLLDGCLNKG